MKNKNYSASEIKETRDRVNYMVATFSHLFLNSIDEKITSHLVKEEMTTLEWKRRYTPEKVGWKESDLV